MNEIWEILYKKAKSVQNPLEISDRIYVGGVSAAIETAFWISAFSQSNWIIDLSSWRSGFLIFRTYYNGLELGGGGVLEKFGKRIFLFFAGNTERILISSSSSNVENVEKCLNA